MKRIKSKMNHRGALAISQIFILVIGIIAISYAVGSEARIVSAGDDEVDDCPTFFVYGGQTYTVHDSEKIVRNDNWWYSKSDNKWEWHNLEGSTGFVSPATEGGDAVYNRWIGLVNSAINCWEQEQAGEGGDGEEDKITDGGQPSSIAQELAELVHVVPAGAIIPVGTDTKEEDEEEEVIKGKKEPPEKEKESVWDSAGWKSLKNIALGAGIAKGIYEGVKWFLPEILGVDEDITFAAAAALGVGYFTSHTLFSLFGKGGVWATESFTALGGIGFGVGLAAITFLAVYKKSSQEIIVFTCQPWDADTGGSECDTCNNQGILPCSEYQCRSLGQACELVNKGTDKEKCVWVDRNDVEFPTIEAWEDALLNDLYRYNKQTTGISPPDSGVTIEYTESTDKCVPAFTPLAFGIETNEPAKCRLDLLRRDSFDDMEFSFSGGLLDTEHSYALSLPSLDALQAEGIEIENNGEYSVYVRCQDANGNSNTANFVFNFCVDKGKDTTPPLIVGTSHLNEYPIAFEQTSFTVEVYTNEPADCSWSHIDQNYNDMEPMTECAKDLIRDRNNLGLYTCIANLTGLKDRVENRFYFRCKDQPKDVEDSDRNVNEESYKYSLIGTQPLVIDSVEPSGIIKGSTNTIKVTLETTTSAGHNKGEATCWYKEADEEEDEYIMFFETNSHKHSQDLWLEGSSTGKDYDYSIRCYDLGGNSDNASVSFSVETDTDAPVVVRAYKEETYLKIITDEPAKCVYDVRDCSYGFEEGIDLDTIDDINHYTDWKTNTNFYIKCKDEYEIQPAPNKCSIVIRPFELY